MQRLKGALFTQSNDGWMIGSKGPISLRFGVKGRFRIEDRRFRNFFREQTERDLLPPKIYMDVTHPEPKGSALHQATGGPWIKTQFKHLVTFFQRQTPEKNSVTPKLDT